MTCKDAKNLMPLCYYGELNAEQSATMRQHLDSCESCRAEFAQVEATLRGITPREVPDLPDEFWRTNAAEIMKRVRPVSFRVVEPSAVAPARPLWAWYAAAAAVVLCALGLVLLVNRGEDPGTPIPPTDAVVWPERVSPAGDTVPAAGKEPEILLEEPSLAEVETNLGMEDVETKMSTFWETTSDTDTENGFSADFDRSLDSLEKSIEDLFIELDLSGLDPENREGQAS